MSTRGTSATVLTPFRSVSGAETIWLIEIPTGLTSPATLRYTTAAYDVTWNSVVWSRLPIAPPSQKFEGPGDAGGVSLTLGDVDGVICGYVEAGATFEGQLVVVYFTDLSATGGSGAESVADEYLIERVDRGEGYVTLTLRNQFGTFDTKVPLLTTTRTVFPGLSPGPML